VSLTHFQAIGGGIILVGGVLTVVATGTRKLVRIVKPVGEFLDDWRGTPARPGVAASPGVMETIQSLKSGQQRLDDGQLHIIDRLARVEQQQTPNGGGSMRDEIQQIKQAVTGPSA
jgi:hypothetical protein